ncbi:MAG: hypothetical protein HWD84_08365 [Flavobacteriaceae bacterium]|nr:hypothetical protein [Flavobacteriaceae bacterium]
MSIDKEISLPDLFNYVWRKRKFIVQVILGFVFIGLIIAFTSPPEWRSSTVLLSEETEGSVGSNLGALGSLAGIDLSTRGGAINPSVYEDLTRSANFLLEVLEKEYYFPSVRDTIKVRTYLDEYTKGSVVGFIRQLPNKILGLFKAKTEVALGMTYNDIVILDRDTDRLIKNLRDRIILKQGDNGEISISVKLQDKIVSAYLTILVREYVKTYVVQYYQGKELRNLKFIEAQLDTARRLFNLKSREYAKFRDGNVGLSSYAAKIEEQRLQSEFNLSSGVYSTLAQRYEEAKIKVQEVTPVFSELEPVTIPPYVDSPKRKLIVCISLLLGGFVSVSFLLFKNILLQLRRNQE